MQCIVFCNNTLYLVLVVLVVPDFCKEFGRIAQKFSHFLFEREKNIVDLKRKFFIGFFPQDNKIRISSLSLA